MSKIYRCEECNKTYTTYMGLWYHNKKIHITPKLEEQKKNSCKYCNKLLSCKQSKWRHEQKCKEKQNIPIDEKFKQLEDKIKVLESKPSNTNNTNTTNNMTNSNNTINNTIQYVINAPTASSLEHLTFEVQKEILDEGLNSLVKLIELNNFNKSVQENHSYCVTAINDKHASVIDEKTNKVVKTNKFDLFDKVLAANLDNLAKLATNPKFTSSQKTHYQEKVNYLKTMMFQNNKFIKRYQSDINLMGYNNKDMVQKTWESLKELSEENDDDEEEPYMGDRPRGFDDLIAEMPEDEKPDFLKKQPNPTNTIKLINQLYGSDSELSDDSDNDDLGETNEPEEFVEIKIKDQMYILENNQIYMKTIKGTKGELYGATIAEAIAKSSLGCTNKGVGRKVKKPVPKEINL